MHSVAEIAAVSAAHELHASPTVGMPPIAQSGVSSVRSLVLLRVLLSMTHTSVFNLYLY